MNVLVVEDHAPSRQAIVAVLNRAEGTRATGVGSIADAADAAKDGDFSVALVDLNLGDESGLDGIAVLTKAGVPCLVLSVSDQASDVTEALRRGALGYLLKDDPPDTVLRALREAQEGRHPISSGVTQHLIPRRPTESAEDAGLTPRETDVLIALARGLSYAEAAESLGCALGTVQTHVKSVYGKLNVNSKTEACAWAYAAGLVR